MAEAEMVFTKVSDTELKVTKTATEVKKHTYTLDYLLSQKAAIEKQRDAQLAQRNAELAEVDALIAECGKQGVVVKPKGVIADPIAPTKAVIK